MKATAVRAKASAGQYLEVKRMAYIITDDCIACGSCESECPGGAIAEEDGKFVINADECIECGACAGVCPVEAPKPE